MKLIRSIILALVCLLASCKGAAPAALAWVVSTFAGSGRAGSSDGTAARFDDPTGVAVDSKGNVYVADFHNHRIRKITPAGVVSTIAGSAEGFADGTAARFNYPTGVAVDSKKGDVHVADFGNHRIRKITKAGEVSTIAGSTEGFADGASAQFDNPFSVAVGPKGNVYVADKDNHRIRKITPKGSDRWEVETLAGSAKGSEDGASASAQFDNPIGVAVDSKGNVYVADYSNHRIRKITPEEGDRWEVSTIAGSTEGFADGAGASAQFNNPVGVAVELSSGNVYVADKDNNRIRKITKTGMVSTLAGSSRAGFADGASAQFNAPNGVAVDSKGNIYVADLFNHRIRKIEYRIP